MLLHFVVGSDFVFLLLVVLSHGLEVSVHVDVVKGCCRFSEYKMIVDLVVVLLL